MAFLKIIQNVKVATHFEEASDSLLFREIPFLIVFITFDVPSLYRA
jgi:hypothetical protein